MLRLSLSWGVDYEKYVCKRYIKANCEVHQNFLCSLILDSDKPMLGAIFDGSMSCAVVEMETEK